MLLIESVFETIHVSLMHIVFFYVTNTSSTCQKRICGCYGTPSSSGLTAQILKWKHGEAK